jgi:tetratricopeptide (TPR) repeat protein
MRLPLALLLIAGFGLSAAAETIDDKQEYRNCLLLARQDPKTAFDHAIGWEGLGGGSAAKHCQAVALISLGKVEEGASRLELLANEARTSAAIKAEMLAQAGQGWTVAGKLERALAVQNAGLKLSPESFDLLVDRAVTHFGIGDFASALKDLDQAITLAPARPDAYAFRAAVLRFQDQNDLAWRDAEKALSLTKGRHPEALLERGILKRLKGDDAGARRDWLAILHDNSEGQTADAARRNIELLDVKVK